MVRTLRAGCVDAHSCQCLAVMEKPKKEITVSQNVAQRDYFVNYQIKTFSVIFSEVLTVWN